MINHILFCINAPDAQVMQPDANVAPTSEYEPIVQLRHAAGELAPTLVEYEPATQLMHVEDPEN